MEFKLGRETLDSVELKCMVISRGLNVCVERDIRRYASGEACC